MNAIAKISDHGNAYYKLYAECYNAIEESSKGPAGAVVLRRASVAFAGLGDFAKQTPSGEWAHIDAAFERASRGIDNLNDSQTRSFLEKLQHAKAPIFFHSSNA